ncbi:MAG: IscS subfamily cysteine desulfurase [Nitrospirota bacterium]|nr:IscS subfamily cysteine desulfurase [Nitrospirota bacterium]
MSVKIPIYMDYQSTTPVDPRVLEAMLPYFTEVFGHPASRNHSFGWDAEQAVDVAREQVAKLIGATAKEVIFTSGGTEAINLAIRGVAEMYGEKGRHMVVAVTDSRPVHDVVKRLVREHQYEVTEVPVDKEGRVSADAVKAALRPDTILISVMMANNEIGTVQDMVAIGKVAKEAGVLLFSDATEAVGKVPVDVQEMGIDLLAVTAHKMYGPKGVGALYVRRRNPRVRLSAQIDGGGHERGMRSGTLNVPGVVGMGKAAELCMQEMPEESARMGVLRDHLENGILAGLDEVQVNGSREHRLPHNLNISFAYVEGESMLMGLKEIALASGSACTTATLEPSYVIRALGVSEELAHSSLRFSIGRFTTEEEVEYVIGRVVETIQRLREMSPLYEMAKEGVDLSQVQWSAH